MLLHFPQHGPASIHNKSFMLTNEGILSKETMEDRRCCVKNKCTFFMSVTYSTDIDIETSESCNIAGTASL